MAAATGKKVAVLTIGEASESDAVSLAQIQTPLDCVPLTTSGYVRLALPESFDALPSFAKKPQQWISGVELILIDAPPVGAFMQQHLAPLCDGVVLVVHSRKRRVAQVARAVETIAGQGATLIGAVLNRHRSPMPRWLDKWGDCPPRCTQAQPRFAWLRKIGKKNHPSSDRP